MQELIQKATSFLEEALPYLQKFKGKIVVIKYGGNAMLNDELKLSVMKDIALLKLLGIHPVIVHGGGPEITKAMEKAKLKPQFIDGLRVTDAATVRIIKRVFKEINSEIRSYLESFHVSAISLSDVLGAKEKNKQLGFVADISDVNTKKIQRYLKQGKIPVISPLATKGKQSYNSNADTAAMAVAVALNAEKLTILTDVDGVLKKGKLLSHLTIKQAKHLIKTGVITKGMIPKVEAGLDAVAQGCKKAHLINGTIPHALLFEIFTKEGVGTELVNHGF